MGAVPHAEEEPVPEQISEQVETGEEQETEPQPGMGETEQEEQQVQITVARQAEVPRSQEEQPAEPRQVL